jgi:uncharacterized membrane protein
MQENNFMITRLISLLFMLALILLTIYFVPIVFIWSINTLFQTAILYTWTNWFAALVLLALIGNGSSVSYKRKKTGCNKEKCCQG